MFWISSLATRIRLGVDAVSRIDDKRLRSGGTHSNGYPGDFKEDSR